jgi:hypothetical protein
MSNVITELKQHLELIKNAASPELQIRELKKFARLISPALSREENVQIASKLIKIFFEEKVKLPAKSTIQR